MNEKGVLVECFVLLILFVFMSILVSGIGLGVGPHGQARAYERLTRRFGGVFQRGGLLRRCSARFRYGPTWVIVMPGSRRGRQRTTQVVMQWPDGRLDWRLETRHATAPSPAEDDAREFLTQDSAFDQRFQVAGRNADESMRLLSDGVRWQVNQIARSPHPSPIRISIRHGRLIVEKHLAIKRSEELEELTQLCIELYDQAMLTRSEGIEFLGDVDEALPIEDPICLVCGERIVSDMVYCRRCFTPHHLDCWQYNGLCSTYGCRETRYSIPAVARPLRAPDNEAAPPEKPQS
jgi:hypothetical protein